VVKGDPWPAASTLQARTSASPAWSKAAGAGAALLPPTWHMAIGAVTTRVRALAARPAPSPWCIQHLVRTSRCVCRPLRASSPSCLRDRENLVPPYTGHTLRARHNLRVKQIEEHTTRLRRGIETCRVGLFG
jgi:hypothetical protein